MEDFETAAWDNLEGALPPTATLEVLGHDEQLATLTRNYRAGRLHHAWLVSGPKGTGKATMACRFAEFMLRYPDPDTAPETFSVANDPVHSQVAKGGHPNVLLLQRPYDQKSKKFRTQITVEEVRRVTSFLQMTSGANAWRIVIVDPADDMSTSAANALLKILEEPPRRTLFFILAHSPRGLLATIRSRCQVLATKPLSDEATRTVLSRQPLTAEMDAPEIERLTRRAGGSARKALEMAATGVLETFEAFIELANAGKEDIGRLHQLAGSLTPANKSAEYRLFTDMLNDHLANRLRDRVANDQVPLASLNQLVTVWETFREANKRAEIWNMDKKQVILNLYKDLRSA